MDRAGDLTAISGHLDMVIDAAIEYAVSTLAAGERFQPAASYESGGEVSRAFFLGFGNPDPVVEAREWVAALDDPAHAVVTYPGEVHYRTAGARKAVAEAIHKVLIRNVGSSREVGATVEDGTLVVSMQCAEAQSGTPGWPAIADVVTACL